MTLEDKAKLLAAKWELIASSSDAENVLRRCADELRSIISESKEHP